MISRDSVYNLLHGLVKMTGSQKGAAALLGVSLQHFNDVLHGRRDLSAKILHALGYRRVVMYEHDPKLVAIVTPAKESK